MGTDRKKGYVEITNKFYVHVASNKHSRAFKTDASLKWFHNLSMHAMCMAARTTIVGMLV